MTIVHPHPHPHRGTNQQQTIHHPSNRVVRGVARTRIFEYNDRDRYEIEIAERSIERKKREGQDILFRCLKF